MAQSHLERDVRWLKGYAIVSTLFALVLTATAFQSSERRARFDEIDVERINVVEADGRLRMVISNRERSPGVVERGESLTAGGHRTGMIFYNDEGTENGGLTFNGRFAEDGHVEAVGSLTFDQYEQDQTLALQYVDDNGTRRSGLAVTDWPADVSTGEMIAMRQDIDAMPSGDEKDEALRRFRGLRGRLRLYAGRARDDGASIVSLGDATGRTRLRLRVDSAGVARIDFLDEDGGVTYSLPDAVRSGRN